MQPFLRNLIILSIFLVLNGSYLYVRFVPAAHKLSLPQLHGLDLNDMKLLYFQLVLTRISYTYSKQNEQVRIEISCSTRDINFIFLSIHIFVRDVYFKILFFII